VEDARSATKGGVESQLPHDAVAAVSALVGAVTFHPSEGVPLLEQGDNGGPVYVASPSGSTHAPTAADMPSMPCTASDVSPQGSQHEAGVGMERHPTAVSNTTSSSALDEDPPSPSGKRLVGHVVVVRLMSLVWGGECIPCPVP
jgi:hypothetical protein